MGRQLAFEETNRIDIRKLKKDCLLNEGFSYTLKWHCGGQETGSIHYDCLATGLSLRYRVRSGDAWLPKQQTVSFAHTQCHFGGTRKWLVCPQCERRTTAVTFAFGAFKCRKCHVLPYFSQQESTIDRLIRKKHKIGKKIFEDYDGFGWQKKKWLHWSTFRHLSEVYIRLDQIIDRFIWQNLES
ncbi:MAG: hypothetical protein HWE07_15690 [Cytophagia bacterium]|nr:hypothetical protein [Cytophagia bacterium]